jgi:hypothetical protein
LLQIGFTAGRGIGTDPYDARTTRQHLKTAFSNELASMPPDGLERDVEVAADRGQ